MRVPHTVPVNTLRAYAASDQTLLLLGERNRQFRAEDLSWDQGVPPSLAHICVQVLVANFAVHFEVLSFLPQCDLDYLYEILSTDLPINIVAPIIQDGIYWQRCCESRWPNVPLDVSKHGNSWKRMYLERHLQEYIHFQEPGYIEWKEVLQELEVCSPYVFTLDIKELKPPRDIFPPEPVPPDECIRGVIEQDHMDLSPIITKLQNLLELSIRFGVLGCGMNFKFSFFKISLKDVENLSRGIENAMVLSTLRLHRCDIDDTKINIILPKLITCETLEVLEFSHCKIGDIGSKSLGVLMLSHAKLKSLHIQNNRIGSEGATGLAYALQEDNCCPLKLLDLQFNLIGDVGAEAFAAALCKNKNLQELNLAGTGMTKTGSTKLADSLQFNNTLQKLNISNNHLGPKAGISIIAAVYNNRRIETLDIRNCGLDVDAETGIHKFVAKNRQAYR